MNISRVNRIIIWVIRVCYALLVSILIKVAMDDRAPWYVFFAIIVTGFYIWDEATCFKKT